MENYFGPNSAAWTARSGVVLDPDKNGPLPFNGAPNMNMIMSQGMMIGADVQQGMTKPGTKDKTSSGDNMMPMSTSNHRMVGAGPNPNSHGPLMNSMASMHPAMMNNMMTATPQSISSTATMNLMAGMQPMNSTAISGHNQGISHMNNSTMSGQGIPAFTSMGRSMAQTMNSTAVNMAGLPLLNANIPPNMFMQTVNFDASQNQDDMNRTIGKLLLLISMKGLL